MKKENLVDTIYREVSVEYEPTRILLKGDVEGKTIVFKNISNCIGSGVGNLVNTRKKLYMALNSNTDEEAYKRIIEALNSKPKFKVRAFELNESKVDLTRLPAIKFYPRDGGRYITSSIIIACLDDETCNASIHRILVLGKRELVARIVPRHLYYIYKQNRLKGKDTPIAIIVGVHPSILLSASMSPPFGVFELGLTHKLTGEILDVAYTPEYNIPVPLHSQIVIEAKITGQLVDEGPFVDLTLTYDKIRKQPLIRVEKIYMHENPLFHIILPGGREHQLLMGFPREAMIWENIRKVVPKVHKVRLTIGGGGWLHAVVAIDKNSEGDAKNAILAAFAAHPSLKHVVVVDGDIDPDNPYEVEWAIATRFQADKDIVIIRNARGSSLDPSSSNGLTTKMGIDATAPLHEREKYIKVKPP